MEWKVQILVSFQATMWSVNETSVMQLFPWGSLLCMCRCWLMWVYAHTFWWQYLVLRVHVHLILAQITYTSMWHQLKGSCWH